MKASKLFFLLLGINLILWGVTTRLLLAPQQRTPSADGRAASRTSASPVLLAPVNTIPGGTNPPVAAPLNWGSLESEDYRIYMKNLRTIRCPEETIRDIIMADIHKLYRAKKTRLTGGQPFEFWKPDTDLKSAAMTMNRKQVQALKQEEDSVLAALFGANWRTQTAREQPEPELDERQWGNLPEEKRTQVSALLDSITDLKLEIMQRAFGGDLSAEDKKKLRELEQQQEQTLASLLTPAEYDDYQLRNSTTAENIRAALNNVNLSKEEFTALHRLQKEADDKFGSFADMNDPKLSWDRDQAQMAVDVKIKNLLGERRFADYQRGRDPEYQDLSFFAQHYNLPVETGPKLYVLQQGLADQRAKIMADRSLNRDQRKAALTAAQTGFDRQLNQTLGPDGVNSYRKHYSAGP